MGQADDVEGLDCAQRAIVAQYWWQRAEGEMTSWVGFGHVLADLRHCSCVEDDGDCGVECTAAGFSGTPYCRQVVGEGGAAGATVVETLCGCAVVVLK